MENTKSLAILANKVKKNKTTTAEKGKVIVFRVPNDIYNETIAKRGKLITEAANNGDTANISINDIIILALRAFNQAA